MTLKQIIRRLLAPAALALAPAFAASAQAILPTSWNFDTAQPEGWTESLGTSNTRYANGQSGQACRLDATNDFVQIWFAEEPGALTYYIKGQNSGGNWQGTFTVQESATGANGSWTALRTFSNADLPTASFTQFSDQPASGTRYVRFYFSNKVQGHNVALDEVGLAIPTATNAQEINVTQGGSNIPSGFTFSVGNATATTFAIQNLGLVNPLQINSIILSGPDAGEFSLSDIPTTISAQSSSSFILNFSNSGSGSRFCTITINNNDASEGSYVIQIYAVAGNFATEPSAQASGLNFQNVSAWDFNVNFSAGSPTAERYLVLRRKGAPVSDAPADGMTYVRGSWIGSSQVVYIGSAGTFNARSVEASTSYHFAVFAVNGPAGYENYLTSSPLTGNVTSNGPAIGSYYAGVDNASPNFVAQLNAALNPSNYFQVFYSNYISTLINTFYVKDTTLAGQPVNAIECQYSGENYLYPASFQWWDGSGNGALSREHCYPQSWMPTYFEADFEDRPEVSDLHNLLPVLQEECNQIRSNFPYGQVESSTYTFLGTSFGDNTFGQEVYRPREKIRGDVARAVMYQATKYYSSEWDFSLPEQISLIVPYGQDEYLLKSWHFDDLPDNMEIARNEYIRTQQNNRNAFIDSITFPCHIRFATMTKWVPLFTVSGDQLTAVDSGLEYQWFLDGEPIDGATSSTHTIESSGMYSLRVRQFEQCPAITSPEVNVILGMVADDTPSLDYALYPNPVRDHLAVKLNAPAAGLLRIYLRDLTGRLVAEHAIPVAAGIASPHIPVNLTDGAYLVELELDGLRASRRFIIHNH